MKDARTCPERDVHALARQLVKLKDQLIQANLQAPNPVDLEAILADGEDGHETQTLSTFCDNKLMF